MEILFKHLYVIRKGIYGLDYLMVGYVTIIELRSIFVKYSLKIKL